MKRLTIRAAIVLTALFLAVPAWAQVVGSVTISVGPVKVYRAGSDQGALAVVTMDVRVGDRIETGPGGRVKVFFTEDNSVLQLGEQSNFVVEELVYSESDRLHRALFRLLRGKVRVIINRVFGVDTEARVETPTAVAGVTGTTVIVGFEPEARRSTVLAVDGEVSVSNSAYRRSVSQELLTGQITFVDRRRVPERIRMATLEEVGMLLLATEVPGPPPTDLDSLRRRNLTDDPVSASRDSGTDEDDETEPSNLTDALRNEEAELEPAGPAVSEPEDGLDDDIGDDDVGDDDLTDDDTDADTTIEIDFPDGSQQGEDDEDQEAEPRGRPQ